MLRGGEPWPSFLIIGQTVANQRPARRGGAEATRLATRGEGGEGLEGGEGGEGDGTKIFTWSTWEPSGRFVRRGQTQGWWWWTRGQTQGWWWWWGNGQA